MKTYDCVIYNGEDHLLELRLNELNRHVDYFVIVESNISFSGIKKNYRFDNRKFQTFLDKIRYVQVGDVRSKRHPAFEEIHWQREWGIRDAIRKGLYDCKDEDIIVLSDIDELPILDNLDNNDIFVFKQIGCQFKFNLRNPGLDPFYGSQAVKFKYLGNPSEFRMFREKHHGITKYNNLRVKEIKNGGFHFSFCMNNKDIIEKLNFYSHYDRLSEPSLGIEFSNEYINECIKNRKDIFNGRFNYTNRTSNLEVMPTNLLPKYIQNNLEKYKEYLA